MKRQTVHQVQNCVLTRGTGISTEKRGTVLDDACRLLLSILVSTHDDTEQLKPISFACLLWKGIGVDNLGPKGGASSATQCFADD